MATTADTIRIGQSFNPPSRPSAVRSHDSTEPVVVQPPALVAVESLAVDARPTQPTPPRLSPISIIVDQAGNYVAEDTLGVVYGVGATPQEAVADFYGALDRRLRLLRAHRGQLHPALAQELHALGRLFPGR